MDFELGFIILILICGFGAASLVWRSRGQARNSKQNWRLLAFGFCVCPIVMAILAVAFSKPKFEIQQFTDMPKVSLHDDFVSSNSCQSCHPQEHHSWSHSYHKSMTQLATPETVIGNFNDVEIELDGQIIKLFRDGDQFLAELDFPGWTDDAAPPRVVVKITMLTGSHHMQAYWFPSTKERMMGILPVIYLAGEERWIPRRAAFLKPPNYGKEPAFGRWNDTCLKCHTTGAIADLPNMAETRVVEFGIACEECHGQGKKHIEKYRNPLARYSKHLASNESNNLKSELVAHPDKLTHKRSSQVCGQCHSVKSFYSDEDWEEWTQKGFVYEPGQDLHQTEVILSSAARKIPEVKELLAKTPGILAKTFWKDGMIRVSGREYNGLLETACHQKGEMSCTSCHQMHTGKDDNRDLKEWADDQLKLGMRSNDACIHCHSEFNNEDAIAKHTHHSVGSSGSDCQNCHMPHTTYGLLKAIRSHQISSPSVLESLETGRPNACNQCHLDKTLMWTADNLQKWFGHEIPEMETDQAEVAASILWTLKGDAGQRALMAWSFNWEPAAKVSGTSWMEPYVAQLLDDPYDAVRLITGRSKIAKEIAPDYDFLSPPKARLSWTQNYIKNWQSTTSTPQLDPARTKSLLLLNSGKVDLDRYEKMIQKRDQSEINLQE